MRARIVPFCTLTALLLSGCDSGSDEAHASAPSTEAPDPELEGAAAEGQDEPGADEEPEDEGEPGRLFAKRFVVQIQAEPNRSSPRIGYLRAGAVQQATTRRPVGYDDCPAGWYELTTGGYVCNRRDVLAFDGERLPERRSVQPDRSRNLPYDYGVVRVERTPMYRRLPTDAEAAEHEGYRIPGAAPPPAAVAAAAQQGAAEAAAGGEPGAEPAAASPSAMTEPAAASPSAMTSTPAATGGQGSAWPTPDPAAWNEAQAPTRPGSDRPQPAAAGGGSETGAGTAVAEATAPDAEEEEDEGPPTLESLEGDGVVMRWLMRGFYVSLDTTMHAGSRRYWRTQQNGFVPIRSVRPARGSDFHGVELDGETWDLPVGYVLSKRTGWYQRRPDGRVTRARGLPGYHHVFRIVGEEQVGRETYFEDPEGHLYRASEITRIDRVARHEEAAEGERWIDVDLSLQTLVAYEGDRPVFATLISSGRRTRDSDPEDWETPTGVFRINSKHLTSTMDGDSAIDGPYSIDDVPYVMYFRGAYAIHSAMWHDLFGRPKSHGCLNMAPADARFMFGWAGPEVPDGWHGAYPTDEHPGTLLVIRGETPGRGR